MQGHSLDSSNSSFPWQIRSCYGSSHEPVIDYIVIAEFDIDTGSTVRHQYPSAIPSCTADWLAENMLPEGVHNRSEDWTYMFLNRDCSRIDQRLSGLAPGAPSQSGAPPDSFLYGINLVRNKKDDSVRRGAIVKAMAIFSRYSFVEAFRGPLIMALDQYYRCPRIETVRDFFNSLKANIPMQLIPSPSSTEQLLMRRGVVSAPAATNHSVDAYHPDSWTFSTRILMKFTNPVAVSPTSANSENAEVESETLEYTVPLSIPLYRGGEEVGDTDLLLVLRLFGPELMRVFHGILTNQRILFVGYNHAASDIAQILFSCVSLVIPPLIHNNILKRVFPYANLSDLSFLEHSGYIAGVTNPMFQSRYEWWDLLVVLDLPSQNCRVFTPAERRVEDGVQAVPVSMAPPPPHHHHHHHHHHKHHQQHPDKNPTDSSDAEQHRDSGSSGGGATHRPHAHAALTATQAAIAARLYQEELVAHESSDLKFITGILQAMAVAGRELGEHWVKQQFYDYTNNIVIQAMDSLYSSNRLVSKKLRRYSFRSNVGHNSIQKSYRLSDRTRRQFAANAHRARILADYIYAHANAAAALTTSSNMAAQGQHITSATSSSPPSAPAVTTEEEEEITESTENAKFAEEFAIGTEDGPTVTVPDAVTVSSLSAPTAVTSTMKGGTEHVYNITQMYILRLLYESNLHPLLEMQSIYAYVYANCTNSEEECQMLLGMLPESVGGLTVLVNGTFHSNPAVRLLTVQICDRLLRHESTRPAVTSLNGYHLSALQQQRAGMENGENHLRVACCSVKFCCVVVP